MTFQKVLLLIGIIALSSCSNESTYDVWVVNNSGKIIKVDFKSNTHKEGPIQGFVIIEEGKSEHIIATRNIHNDALNVCDSVALYVRASDIVIGRESKLKWCDESIKKERIDIGQYQFRVEYNKEHFE
ncbi:MAG: hypothetical protein V3V00_12515 [Saprospiraceae bacterium]